MIVTLNFIYLFFYLHILINVFFLLSEGNTLYSMSMLNISEYFYYIKKYKAENSQLIICIYLLTGIPPAILFLVKFNIIAHMVLNTGILSSFLIFLSFLLNMFFYSQIFNFKNYLNSSLLVYLKLKRTNTQNLTSVKTNTFYNYFYKTHYILLIFIFSILFYTDFFLILINVHNKAMYKIH